MGAFLLILLILLMLCGGLGASYGFHLAHFGFVGLSTGTLMTIVIVWVLLQRDPGTRVQPAYGQLPYAAFLARAVALILDLVLVFAVQGCLVYAYMALESDRLDQQAFRHDVASLLAFMQPVTTIVYFATLEAACGATLGKLLVGVRVEQEGGEALGPLRAVARNICKYLSFIFPLLFLMPLWTRRRQALHDMMSYCVVVRR